jgi:hypothetical protein
MAPLWDLARCPAWCGRAAIPVWDRPACGLLFEPLLFFIGQSGILLPFLLEFLFLLDWKFVGSHEVFARDAPLLGSQLPHTFI